MNCLHRVKVVQGSQEPGEGYGSRWAMSRDRMGWTKACASIQTVTYANISLPLKTKREDPRLPCLGGAGLSQEVLLNKRNLGILVAGAAQNPCRQEVQMGSDGGQFAAAGPG